MSRTIEHTRRGGQASGGLSPGAAAPWHVALAFLSVQLPLEQPVVAQLARPGALPCPADSTAPPAPLLLLLFQTRITTEGQQEGKEQTGAALGHHITPAPVSEPAPGSTGNHCPLPSPRGPASPGRHSAPLQLPHAALG